jgi:hypothetical protein
MAWAHLRAAIESNLYDGQGSYKSILLRICSLVRGNDHQHAGWCTASEKYLAQTTGYSERQVQRAVAQFRKDGVFAIRTFKKGGKKFNHYRPNMAVINSRKRNPEEAELISETVPDDMVTGADDGTRQPGGSGHDTLSNSTRQDGGVVGISREVKGERVNAIDSICRAELRSSSKGHHKAVTNEALSGKDDGGSAPEPPLFTVQSRGEEPAYRMESESEAGAESGSPLRSAAKAAHSRQEMLAAGSRRDSVPAPPPRDRIAPPPASAAPRPTTPFQVAKALVEQTKKSAWDTFLRGYSLATQFAGYLEERRARGEKAYAFNYWETSYTADFIEALNRGWKFKDIEDAIDLAQTTKFRFVCCTPRRLFESGESVMKLVHVMRRKGKTARQKLGDSYSSWYIENADSIEVQEMKRAVSEEAAAEEQEAEEERQREIDLDADIPILRLRTTGRIKCITPECPYRFDTWEQMGRHFADCFQQLYDAAPIDPEAVEAEEFADRFDDECGVLPCAIYPWFEEDESEGRWELYAPENVDGGMMFDPWAAQDAEPSGADSGSPVDKEVESRDNHGRSKSEAENWG